LATVVRRPRKPIDAIKAGGKVSISLLTLFLLKLAEIAAQRIFDTMNEPTAIPHVLVVEDEQILQKFLVFHVEQAGYRATPLSQGAEIIETVESQAVDLILLDLGLPDGDGLSRAQQVREHSNVPIIVLTGRQGEDDRIMALGLGADDYLTKPCDPRELLLRMRNLLERSGKAPSATLSAAALAAATQSSAPPVIAQNPPDNGKRKKRQGDRRQPEKDPRVPEPAAAATSKTGLNFALIGVAAVLFLAAGSGATWFLLNGGDTAQDTVAPKAARTGPLHRPPPRPASQPDSQLDNLAKFRRRKHRNQNHHSLLCHEQLPRNPQNRLKHSFCMPTRKPQPSRRKRKVTDHWPPLVILGFLRPSVRRYPTLRGGVSKNTRISSAT
jgi:CheY-like chemotaxis protein